MNNLSAKGETRSVVSTNVLTWLNLLLIIFVLFNTTFSAMLLMKLYNNPYPNIHPSALEIKGSQFEELKMHEMVKVGISIFIF